MTYKELKEYKEDLIQKHLNGMTIGELCQEYNSNKNAMYDIVSQAYRNSMNLISDQEIAEIQQLYASGVSSNVISERLQIHSRVVLQCVRLVMDVRHRVYQLDEHYFDVIDSPNKAYILGFLYADGYNNYQTRTVSLDLKYVDVDILRRISKELKTNRPLLYTQPSDSARPGEKYTSKPHYKLSISSKRISKRLSELGIVENKSLILQFPTYLADELIPHFIRGYFDGDGCLYANVGDNNKPYNQEVCITQTESFCESMKDVIKHTLGIDCHIHDASCHNGTTKNLRITGRMQCNKFLDWIYKDADLMLDRKHEKYLTQFKY